MSSENLDIQYTGYALDAGAGIWIDKSNRALRVRVTRDEPKLLEPFQSLFRKSARPIGDGDYSLEATSMDASRILEECLPYLRLKKPLAELGIYYQKWKAVGHLNGKRYSEMEQQRQKEFVEQMRVLRSRAYYYNIGEESLTPQYLAALLDQREGFVDISNKIIQMSMNNKSFMFHLKKEYGGRTYPKDHIDPWLWRVTGEAADKFLEKTDPFRLKSQQATK